jgi:hypothetical protein
MPKVVCVTVTGCGEWLGPPDNFSFGTALVKYSDGTSARVNLDMLAKFLNVDRRFGVAFSSGPSPVVCLNGQYVDLTSILAARS